jgi:tight adherence protein C
MMELDLLGIVTAAVVAVTILFVLLALSGAGQKGQSLARQRLEGFTRGQPDADLSVLTPSVKERLIGPAFQNVARSFGNLLPKSMLAGVERKLITAGEPMTLNGFLTMLLISTAASVGFGLLLVVAVGAQVGPLQLGIILGLAVVGFFLPFYIVNSRARQRQNAIIKSLPDSFDLITTCVEAGLGLDAALSRVAEKVEGPFAQELSRALRDIALGKSRREALKELGDRTGVPDLIQFTNAVIQAEAMGSSVGQVLRVQSDQLRVRRRQRAEEQAYKAPVKMLFPLVLCIFPTLFIVILGPAIITIMEGFPK